MESWTGTSAASVTVVLSGVIGALLKGILVTKGHHEEVINLLKEDNDHIRADRDAWRARYWDATPVLQRSAVVAEEALELAAGPSSNARRRGGS